MKFFKIDKMFGTPKEYYFCCEYSQEKKDKNKTLRKFQH